MKTVVIITIIGVVIAAIGSFMLIPEPEEPQEIEKPVNPVQEKESTVTTLSQECSGNARCITGKVTQVIDGDTIKVDGQSIRFALSSAPELDEFGGNTARDFIFELCPIGSTALVDEDDGQTQGSYGRILGAIVCNGVNLNSELLDSNLGYIDDRFCDQSEFSAEPWAQKHGCSSLMPESKMQPAISSGFQVDVYGQQQVRRGTTHDITIDVTRDGNPVSDSLVIITIETYGEDVIRKFKGKTDDSGRFVFSWEIPKSFDDIETLLAYVDVTDDISAKTILFKFQVYCLPGESGCNVER